MIFGIGIFTDNPQEALKYFEQSLTLRLGLWEQHPAIGSTYNNISLCYQRLGKHDKALDFSRKGLVAKRQFKGNGKEMVNSLNNMAVNLCLVSGSYEEAIELLKEALLILEKLDLDTLDAATIYTSMSFVYQRMGRLDGALPWCQKAVDLRRTTSGSTHTITIRLVTRLCSMLYQMAKYEDARDQLETQLIENQANSGDDLQKSAELLRKVYLKTGEYAKADLIQQKSTRDLVVLLKEQRNTVQPNIEDMTEEGTESNVANQETTSGVDSLQKETDGSNLDDVDSDDDLYGPEDSSSVETTLQFQSIKTQAGVSHVKTSNETQLDSEKFTIARCQSEEEDLYCSSKDAEGRMSVSASPELVDVDADVTEEEEVEDESTFHRVGFTNSLRSDNEVQHPIAEMKPVATLESNQQKQQIRRPQKLQLSSQSAFASVGRLSTHHNNNTVDNRVIADNNHDHHQSLSNARQQPISQPEDETYKKPFQTFSGAVTQQHQTNNNTPNLVNRGTREPSVTLRHSNNPFHSCQIGYQQYRPEPTYVQSLPYLGHGTDQTGPRGQFSEVSNLDVINNRVSVPKRQTWNTSTNGIKKITFEDLEDVKLLTPKQIEGSNNVLRLVFGYLDDSSDEDLFP